MDIYQGYGETGSIESYETVIANATKFGRNPPENGTEVLTCPLKFSSEMFDVSFDTSADFIGNMTDSSFLGYVFGNETNGSWLLCMFAGILCIFGAIQNHILPLFLHHHSTDIEGTTLSSHPSKFALLFKNYFLLPRNIQHISRLSTF